MDEEAERLVLQMAKENPSWGYDRIVGALKNLGHQLSHQTVGNILRRHGLSPAPKRKQAICWKDFIRSHMPREFFPPLIFHHFPIKALQH